MAESAKARIALIGCGAMTEFVYLPLAQRSRRFEVAVLVDPVESRAEALAARYGIGAVAVDHRRLAGQVAGAIVVAPNHLHAPLALELLRDGIHVLVEKPMALQAAHCERMIDTARRNQAILSVGLVRRYYQNSLLVKKIVDAGVLGPIRRVDVHEGHVFNWNVRSDSLFKKETGGGTLADIGSHVLDLLLWWLGDCESCDYYDDAFGGVESNCEIYLRLKNGATAQVILSSSHELSNTIVLEGEKATLELGVGFKAPVKLTFKDTITHLCGMAMDGQALDTTADLYLRQIHDFIGAIEHHRAPFISGEEGSRAVHLIERCYAARQTLDHPWVWKETLAREVSA